MCESYLVFGKGKVDARSLTAITSDWNIEKQPLEIVNKISLKIHESRIWIQNI